MAIWIYNLCGIASLQMLDDQSLVSVRGIPVGFLDDGKAYDFNRNHRGWYLDGILRVLSGDVVGFTSAVTITVHPSLPVKAVLPVPSVPQIRPIRPVRAVPFLKPVFSTTWSRLNPFTMFGHH